MLHLAHTSFCGRRFVAMDSGPCDVAPVPPKTISGRATGRKDTPSDVRDIWELFYDHSSLLDWYRSLGLLGSCGSVAVQLGLWFGLWLHPLILCTL